MRWIERVGLKGYEDNYPAQLSGGMQQRVGLARALATDADILLMDEAFSALDPLIRTDMQRVLLDLQKELHKTIVFITHDLDEALRLGDRIAILRDGEIVQQGTPQDIVLRPADDYISSFVREVNRGRVIQVETVMETPQEGAAPAVGNRPIAKGTVLEEAARRMTGDGAVEAHVVNGDRRADRHPDHARADGGDGDAGPQGRARGRGRHGRGLSRSAPARPDTRPPWRAAEARCQRPRSLRRGVGRRGYASAAAFAGSKYR